MRATAISLAMALMCATPVAAQDAAAPFDAQARVTEALGVIRPMAYHGDTLDWTAIEARARALAATAKDEVDLLPAYQALVWYLEDNHSFIVPSPALRAGWTARYGDRRLLPDSPRRPTPDSAFKSRTEVGAHLTPLESGRAIAVVIVPAVAQVEAEVAPYGVALYAAVAAVEAEACGYVVDVRGNTGGDVWPMITGLSDLIGDEQRFEYIGREGPMPVYAMLRQGSAVFTDGADFRAPASRVDNWRSAPGVDQAPVAVLIDGGTASSGEGVALALIGREGVRTFGSPSMGLTTANEEVQLSDGMRLFISTSTSPDRAGRTYPEGITPDTPVAPGPGDAADPADAVEEAAKAWLATQAACRAAGPR